MVRIVVGGDICPMGKIEKAFSDGSAEEIFHDLLGEIEQADLSVVNIECPLISRKTPIVKIGEVLGADIKCIHGFKAANWNLINLANNHVFDHGVEGLKETMTAINNLGLDHLGAGVNIAEAQMPFIKEIRGKRVVIYSMAEHEFSIADKDTPGANPLDLINLVRAIRLFKQDGYFIVLIHGGNEFYPFPSPEVIRRCRFMVDMGADAVICCHTHCPLPWEIHAGRPIVYGIGNLIFEPIGGQVPNGWHEGYLAKLIFDDSEVRLEVVPYVQSSSFPGAKTMDENPRKLFLDEMEWKNEKVRDSEYIEGQWLNYCLGQKDRYLSGLLGYNRFMRKTRKLLLKYLHSKKDILRALHLVQCEAHGEVLNTIFKELRKNNSYNG